MRTRRAIVVTILSLGTLLGAGAGAAVAASAPAATGAHTAVLYHM